MDSLLEFNHVEISYNGKSAVHDVSFSLSAGEILGIVGESGSGKSTLLRAAMGLLGQGGLVTRGDIWFQSQNLPNLSARELRALCGRELGMIFQNCGAALCPVRTIDAQIYESVTAHCNASRAEVHAKSVALLAALGIDNPARVLKSYPFELSGGMSQRVGICIAMLLHPSVLLADEPTSALDMSAQRQVLDALLTMREKFHTAIVLVTHNIGVVTAMADKVLVLKDGCTMDYGEAEKVLHAPESSYTKALLAAVPRLRRC